MAVNAKIIDSDIIAAQSQMITNLINEILQLRASAVRDSRVSNTYTADETIETSET